MLMGESGEYDIIITEIGGTVGDIESLPYIESVRQLVWELGEGNAMVIHLTLIPFLSAAGELNKAHTTLCENINGEWGKSKCLSLSYRAFYFR